MIYDTPITLPKKIVSVLIFFLQQKKSVCGNVAPVKTKQITFFFIWNFSM